jgi:hypothetical protein
MTEPSAPLLPAWVHKRDGRQAPFEADKISRALFAASETLGRPDAFLARELTDGVVHFLTLEVNGVAPSTEQIAETVVKTVRELGQPALAQAFAAGAERKSAKREASAPEVVLRFPAGAELPEMVRGCARAYTLQEVYARDLAAAQDEGLLTLTGLETPLELAGCAVERPGEGGWTEALVNARAVAGAVVAVEGLEYSLDSTAPADAAADRLARELHLGSRAAGLGVVVNLNIARPPTWADDLAEGPLFVAQRRPVDAHRLAWLGDALLLALHRKASGANETRAGRRVSEVSEGACELRELAPALSASAIRVDWHLSKRDFQDDARDRLMQAAQQAAQASMAFVFDRPRMPVALAEGMDRRHPAVLLSVGLHLARLLDQPGVRSDPPLFLQKVGSLARLALSAGVQKRDFLRRSAVGRPGLTRGFLLDRARLVVVPVGLEEVVRALTGASLCEANGLDLGRRILERLQQVTKAEGLSRRLHVQLDSPLGEGPPFAESAGLSATSATAPVKNQLRAAGALHAVAASGTAWVRTPGETTPPAEQIADWLKWTWQQTDIVRLRWAFSSAAARQLALPIEG